MLGHQHRAEDFLRLHEMVQIGAAVGTAGVAFAADIKRLLILCEARIAQERVLMSDLDNRLLEAATPRERLYVQALGDWLQGAPSRSVARLEEVLRAHPEDALAMKLSQAIRFVLGDAEGMRRSVERVMPAYAPDHPGRGYLLGCHAFALEETGDYTAAEYSPPGR